MNREGLQDMLKAKRKVYRDGYRYVLLKIHSRDLDPDEVTKVLGIEPTWSCWRGTWTAPTGVTREHKEGFWAIASRLRRNASLENHVRDVWDQVSSRKPSLKRILRKAKAFLAISVEPHPDVVDWTYTFSAEALKEFVDLGINIRFSFKDPHAWG